MFQELQIPFREVLRINRAGMSHRCLTATTEAPPRPSPEDIPNTHTRTLLLPLHTTEAAANQEEPNKQTDQSVRPAEP